MRPTARRTSDRDHGVAEARWARPEKRYAEWGSLSEKKVGAERTSDPPQRDKNHVSWQYCLYDDDAIEEGLKVDS